MSNFSILVLVIFLVLSPSGFPKDQIQACGKGQHWVRPHHRSAYFRADGTHVSAANVIGHCQTNPTGFDFWNPKKKNGLPPGWEHPQEKPKKWTDKDWERVLEALSELPETLWVPTIEGLYRLEKSVFDPNPASGEPGNIALYDPAFTSKDKLAQTLAHELAHELYRNFNEDELASYRDATQWFQKKIGKRTHTIRGRSEKQFILPDGMDSPSEDFSNHIEYYLFNPQKLQSVTPSAYQWIKQYYGDKLKLRGGK